MSANSVHSNRPGRRLRRDPPRRDRTTRRLLTQLGVVLALLALWTGACWALPEQTGQWKEALSQLLTQSTDWGEACHQLGEDLAQGEAPLDALEDWCVQVFLPAGLSLPEGPAGEG